MVITVSGGYEPEVMPGSDEEWQKALEEIDSSKGTNKSMLLRMLRSGHQPSPVICTYIADLLDRYRLAQPRGGQRLPSYYLSFAEFVVQQAKSDVRSLTKPPHNLPFEEALAQTARRLGLKKKTLRNACENRRGSTQRRERRQR